MARPRKYQTEEERKAAHNESNRKWHKKNPDYDKNWKEKNSEMVKKWREENSDYYKQWYAKNSEKCKEYRRKFREKNPDYDKQYKRKYYNTQIGRANMLASSYRKHDKNAKRGECTITAQWIIDNIFTSKCIYCGETDWTELGCDRIDNDLPHTPENVVCCCEKCNKERHLMPFEEFLAKNNMFR